MDLLSTLNDVFNLKVFLLAALIFVPLERLFAMRSQQKMLRSGWRNDLIYVFINGVLIKAGVGTLTVGIILLAGWMVPASFRAAVAEQPYWLQIAQAVVIADLGFYVIHRAFHAVPWLWKFHAIHHSIEELDWLAAFRVHPLDQVLTRGGSLLPLFALGFSEVAIAAWAVIYHWQSLLIHANVRIGFGPLRWLVASPEFHHWHHTQDQKARDRNFAGQLSFLDAAFGTLHLPFGELPGQYGVEDPVPKTYLPQLLYPFRGAAERIERVADCGEAAKQTRLELT